jgi:hypothetical protein
MSVGRISGPLLRSNLQRTDDLAFETDLLYINHSGSRIGVKTDSPTRTLQVDGVTHNSTFITATNSATFGNMLFENASISAMSGPISLTSSGTIEMPQLRVGDVYFNDNILGTYTSNTDLELRPNPLGGELVIPSNLEVYGNIHATGNIVADGNIVIGDDSTDSLTIGADIDSDIIPDANLTYKVGDSPSKQWGDTFAATGNVAGDITVSNQIAIGGLSLSGTYTLTGTTFTFGDQNTDSVIFNAEIVSDLIPQVNNVYNLGSNSKNWDNVYTRQFEVGDITITDNYIFVNQSNLDLVIQANGTGRVVVDNLRFNTIVDSTAGNINIANSTHNSTFNGSALTLAQGNAAQRPNVNADMRYNSATGDFEGYATAPVLLGKVSDLDKNTRIELNSDEFYFYANGVNTGRIDTAGNMIVNRFHSQSQFALDNNTVTVATATPGSVTRLTANGTGVVQFDTSNYVFNNGSIRNTVTNSDIQFQMTGVTNNQYVHFSANEKGVRLPYGTTDDRNPGVIGELYWNTTLGRLQVYNGTVWGNAAGISGAIVTVADVEEINVIYELILA